MWKKVLIVGATSAAIVGAGTAALAVTGSSSPTPSPSAGASTGSHHDKARAGLRHTLHGTFVTRAGKGATGFVTHDEIRGTVTAVSATSITVKAADGYSQTYAVTASTVEHLKTDGKSKGTAGRIAQVHVGDRVGVVGTGTSAPTATHVLDAGVGKTSTS